jgi:hypothetical protein
MRFDDDDHSQSFGPVLRRIAILAVIITAVPVMLWSITSFMRTYVAQPVISSPRPLAFTTSPTVAPTSSADNSAPSQANAPVVEARATATDASGKGDQASDAAAPAPSSTVTAYAAAPATAAQPAWPDPRASDQTGSTSAGSPWPDPSQAIGERRLQAATSGDDSADALPASAPLTGPIPLPPHRPKFLAMADGAIPLPRKRPGGADATADPPPAEEGNFLTHLFGQTH